MSLRILYSGLPASYIIAKGWKTACDIASPNSLTVLVADIGDLAIINCSLNPITG